MQAQVKNAMPIVSSLSLPLALSIYLCYPCLSFSFHISFSLSPLLSGSLRPWLSHSFSSPFIVILNTFVRYASRLSQMCSWLGFCNVIATFGLFNEYTIIMPVYKCVQLRVFGLHTHFYLTHIWVVAVSFRHNCIYSERTIYNGTHTHC